MSDISEFRKEINDAMDSVTVQPNSPLNEMITDNRVRIAFARMVIALNVMENQSIVLNGDAIMVHMDVWQALQDEFGKLNAILGGTPQ